MNCTQMDQYLDAMLDGTLSAEDLESVEAHCHSCAACAEKLKANRQMMRMFAEMAPEMDVPLEVQAAWRSAVKRETGRVRQRYAVRYAGGIAAALVVALVATFALRTPPSKNGAEMFTAENAEMTVNEMAEAYAAPDEAFIEIDGAAEAAQEDSAFEAADEDMTINRLSMAAGAPAPMHEIEMVVDDVERVCDYARDLTQEYEGEIEIQGFEEDGVPCANLFVDLPEGNATEFIEAMRHFDQTDAQPEAIDVAGETSFLLVLKSK